MELLAMQRAGQLKKPLGFSQMKELGEIKAAQRQKKLRKLTSKPHSSFEQIMHNHHSDEY